MQREACAKKDSHLRYRYSFTDDLERVSGVVDAPDAAMAAIHVLGENNRHRRHGIKESHLGRARGAELVEISGYAANSYSLDIAAVGTRKRKPMRMHA